MNCLFGRAKSKLLTLIPLTFPLKVYNIFVCTLSFVFFFGILKTMSFTHIIAPLVVISLFLAFEKSHAIYFSFSFLSHRCELPSLFELKCPYL